MATVADRLALGYKPAAPGTAVIPRPYTPNFTIPDPRIEAQFQRASAEAAHGERVNPTAQKPSFPANDPRAYGDGRFGAPASQPTPTPAPKPLAAQAAQTPKGPFYQRPLGDMARGGASATGGLAKKAASVFSAPAAVGLAGITGAVQGYNTDTEQYAKRFGLENTEPGVLRDLGIRSLGVASDVGNALTLGIAGNMYRDKQDPPAASPAVAPNPKLSPLAQMDPTSAAMKDPANPMKPQQGASAALAAPSGAQEVRPGIFRQGNSFSDTAAGAAEGARPAPISAQNMAAADALAARSQAQSPLVQAAQAPASQNLTPPESAGGTGYGLLNSNRIAARNAMMDVQQMKPGSGTALKALLQSQNDAPKMDLEREQMAQKGQESAADRQMRGTELMARLGESSADRGLKARELADNALVNAAKREQLGVETGAAKQMADLRSAYLNAKTPEEQAAAAAKLNALAGKVQQDEYMSVGGGETVDAVGNVVKNPDVLVNKRTGQPAQGGQAKAQSAGPAAVKSPEDYAKLPSGAVFIGPDGKQYRKN
jgi:hypothetical protein